MNAVEKSKKLSLFAFFAMTASMVMTVYEYPSFATSQFPLVFFALVGGIFWFLPTALISAEMASVDGWSVGGAFGWVGNAFHSDYAGFVALFYQWFQITVGFVTMSYFIVGMLSNIFNWPELNGVPWIKFIAVAIVFLLINIAQLGGTKYTARIAQWGFVGGILGASIIFFGFAIAYLAQGNPVQIKMSASTFFPDWTQTGVYTIFATFILAYTGIEASGAHINELNKPERNYPLAMLMLVVLAIALDALGGIAVAAVIPQESLSLNGGIYQTLQFLMFHFNPSLNWLLIIVVLMIVLGVIAEIGSWAVGPSAGMRTAAQYGVLPRWIDGVNKHGVPVNMMLIQGIVFLFWDAVLTFGGTGGGGNVSFLVATTLTTCIYLCCYLFMYAAYWVLIFKRQHLHRTYHVPGGIVGKVIVAFCGSFTSIFTLIMSFTPSTSLPPAERGIFLTLLIICFAVAFVIPFIVAAFKKEYIKHAPDVKQLVWHEEVADAKAASAVKAA